MSKFYGLDKFQVGDFVTIADRSSLEDFMRSWKLHHPLHPEQVLYSGRVARVADSFMFHGGSILYQLEAVPGLWHQQLLAKPVDGSLQ